MHPISDKELDRLFQQRFEEAEFPPSGDVWAKISSKMNHREKTGKSFPVLWMAASVLVILSAGLWFYRPVQVIRLQGMQEQLAQNTTKNTVHGAGTQSLVGDHVHPVIKGFDFSKLAPSKESMLNSPAEVIVPDKTDSEPKQELVTNNSPRKPTQEIIQQKNEVKIPRYTGDQSQLDVTQPDMIASTEVIQDDLVLEHERSAPRKIRSVGSLVNFVISKVDRRDDKIIEFKDGEEGSEVSGINLGLIKLKSRDR